MLTTPHPKIGFLLLSLTQRPHHVRCAMRCGRDAHSNFNIEDNPHIVNEHIHIQFQTKPITGVLALWDCAQPEIVFLLFGFGTTSVVIYLKNDWITSAAMRCASSGRLFGGSKTSFVSFDAVRFGSTIMMIHATIYIHICVVHTFCIGVYGQDCVLRGTRYITWLRIISEKQADRCGT